MGRPVRSKKEITTHENPTTVRRILVKRVAEQQKTAGGLHIPDSAKEKPLEAIRRGRMRQALQEAAADRRRSPRVASPSRCRDVQPARGLLLFSNRFTRIRSDSVGFSWVVISFLERTGRPITRGGTHATHCARRSTRSP